MIKICDDFNIFRLNSYFLTSVSEVIVTILELEFTRYGIYTFMSCLASKLFKTLNVKNKRNIFLMIIFIVMAYHIKKFWQMSSVIHLFVFFFFSSIKNDKNLCRVKFLKSINLCLLICILLFHHVSFEGKTIIFILFLPYTETGDC